MKPINFVLVIQNLHWYNNAVATVAQLAEQALRKRQVKGSSPFGGFFCLQVKQS